MSLRRVFIAFVGCALFVTALGAIIGYGLGRFAPGYYRGIFSHGNEPEFDPLTVGVGLGMTQGAAGGVVAGLVLVALLVWRETRLARAEAGPPLATAAGPATAARWVLLAAAWLLSLIVAVTLTFWVGQHGGRYQVLNRQYLLERDLLARAIGDDPAFAGVEVDQQSNGELYVVGEVASQTDLDRLRAVMTKALGDARGTDLARNVDVRPEPTQ